ncbi:hypothetical protein HDV02_005187 [Globomyces sp. JEL0801]|nr:hypothetical protein HDV02_005187 [Globomyces sp. JEL0801]
MTLDKTIIGKRVIVDGEVATIKYYGPIEGKTGFYYGVEWDDLTRGKNNGSFKGKQYFETTLTGGSFLKSVNMGIDFLTALSEKYAKSDYSDLSYVTEDTNTLFETIGWEKMKSKLSQLGNLKEISLARLGVSHKGNTDLPCKSIEDADLSHNLFSVFSEISGICEDLPNLRILRINYNRFAIDPLNPSTCFTSITVLGLIGTQLTWDEITKLSPSFPNLEELYVGYNGLKFPKKSCNEPEVFAKVKILDLENNLLSDWNDITNAIGKFPHLANLSLRNNRIAEVLPPNGNFRSLTTLNLNGNKLNSWDVIHVLNLYNITQLRITQNPICETIDKKSRHQILTGRLSKLTKLDGSTVTDMKRQDAECYYLTIASQDHGNPNFSIIHPLYELLCKKHGEPAAPMKVIKTVADSLIQLTLQGQSTEILKKVPKHMKVRALKTIMARSLYGKEWQSALRGELFLKVDDDFQKLEDEMKELEYFDVLDGSILRLQV